MRGNVWRRAPWLLLGLGLLGEAVVLLVQDRRLWFYRDDLAFVLGRHISRDPITALFAPHSVHWSTLPVIAFRVMYSLFGLRHYLPYALMPLVLHLGLAACLVVLARRAGAGRWPAVLSGLVFAYLGGGAGAENPLWAFQIGFIGSCLAGIAALICLESAHGCTSTRSARRWFWAAQALLVAALMCSDMGVPLVVAAGAWAVLRRGWVAALRTVLLPALAFAAWYLAWGRFAFAAQPPGPGVVRALGDAALAAAELWRAATGVPGAGVVLLLALVAAVLWTHRLPGLRALAAAGLIGLAFEYLVIGLGRSDLAVHLHSRYVYVGLALSTPALACGLNLIGVWIGRRQWVGAVAFLVTAALVIAVGSVETARFAALRRATDPARAQQLWAAAALIRAHTPLLSSRIDPTDPSRVPAMSVRRVVAARALGDLPAGQPGPGVMFDERSLLQVNVARYAMKVPTVTKYRWWGARPQQGSCTARTTTSVSRLAVPLGAHGGQLAITLLSRADGAVHTALVRAGERSIRSTWPLTSTWQLAGAHLYVASTVHDATLVVTLPPGRIAVCAGA